MPTLRSGTTLWITLVAALVLAIALPTTARAGVSDTRKCIASLLANAGAYAKCRYKVESVFFTNANRTKRDEAAAKCAEKHNVKAASIYDKYGAGCPGGEVAAVAPSSPLFELAELFFGPAWAQLSGSSRITSSTTSSIDKTVSVSTTTYSTEPTSPTTVSSETAILLSTLSSDLSAGPITDALETSPGVTTRARPAPGTSFVDTALGTVIDEGTGLEWELKTTDGSVHDANNLYRYSNVCVGVGANHPGEACEDDSWCAPGTCDDTILGYETARNWVGALNQTSFAGQTDWRIPTVAELNTLKKEPCLAYPAPCTNLPGPTNVTATGTDLGLYWTADTKLFPPNEFASWLQFAVSYLAPGGNHSLATHHLGYVRAVRTKFIPTTS